MVTATAKITSRHLADLRLSGLSDNQIAECGFYSVNDRLQIQTLLRWKRYDGHLGDCLAIPFRTMAGMPTQYVRLKPDHPRKDKEGKPIKYESPQGVGNLAYFPPLTRSILFKTERPLIITEGEKKAAKADQEGFGCIGLVGVYGWQKKREMKDGHTSGSRELIDDLDGVFWTGREVYICYDSDAATNSNVLRAEMHLVSALNRRGAITRAVRIPSDVNGYKIGIDDFLVRRGPGQLCDLLRTCR